MALRLRIHNTGRIIPLIALAGLLFWSPPASGETYCGLLVVGIPDHDSPGGQEDSGAVAVLHTFEDIGVDAGASQFFNQSSTDFGSSPFAHDSFGRAVVVADFNGDHYPDMAIGVPWEDVGGQQGAGAVQVVYGTVFGMVLYMTQFLHHAVVSIEGDPSYRGQFGAALAAGDFNGDGYDDLAVGTPEYYLSDTVGHSGAVNVMYGSANGITSVGDQIWTQGSTDVLGEPEDLDWFGAALATGDFDGDGYDDLAIGVPLEDLGETSSPADYEAGAVNVLYGTASGLSAARNQFWTQGAGLEEQSEDYDHFGAALASGDFNGDGKDDLAIGVPDERIASGSYEGVVHMVCGWGAGLGLVTWNDELWSQDSPGIQDDAESGDRFGAALAAGDFDGDGYDDLAIGAPDEDLFDGLPDHTTEAGVVQIIHGSSSWLEPQGNLLFSQATPGIADEPEYKDHFGTALAAADLDSDGYADLVIGVPGEHPDGISDAGVVHAVYGSTASLYSSRYEFWHLGTPGVAGANQADSSFGDAVAAGNFSLMFTDDFERGTTERWYTVVP